MLTLPKIVDRDAQPYLAIKQQVTIPFDAVVDRVLPELFGWLGSHGVAPTGALFFKYNSVKMPELELEFGVPVAPGTKGDARMVLGMLPAGRYATTTYTGPYDKLMDVNAVLIGWAKETGVDWDSHDTTESEAFACRMEIYLTDPADEPDPNKWQTEVAIKVKDV